KVTGWTTTTWNQGPPDMPPYVMWTKADGQSIGGVMALPAEQIAAGVPPHWIAYVGTPDIDATHAEALRLGATQHVPPTDIPTVGRFSVLADPQGATFALFTPGRPGGPEPEAADVGDVSWHELYTTDLPAAWAFYSGLFGWVETS